MNYQFINALQVGTTIKAGDYYCKRSLSHWLEFNSYQPLPYINNESDLGWKLHFSFDRTIPGNLEKGIDIVMKHLVEKDIPSFKIIPKNKEVTERTTGKDITVYISDNRPIQEWDNLINTIESSLLEVGVIPGRQAMDTEMILGGRFTSYRNDMGLNGEYTQEGFNQANTFNYKTSLYLLIQDPQVLEVF